MIDRSYLPFKSARDYQDVKMQKWMGFFLSEHSSALYKDETKIDASSNLTLTEKFLLLNQVYTKQLNTHITLVENNTKKYYLGIVSSITKETILLKNELGYREVSIDDILEIGLIEEDYHESA